MFLIELGTTPTDEKKKSIVIDMISMCATYIEAFVQCFIRFLIELGTTPTDEKKKVS